MSGTIFQEDKPTMTAEEKLKKIKQSLRLLMNGVTSQSLREKGLEYHLNWGANLIHLREMASEYESNYDLAIMLWKEDIRECKILATMLMPVEKFDSDIAMVWIEQLRSQEIAEILSLNLLQHVNYAGDIAFQLMAENNPILQLCGFNVIGRLFVKQMELNERDINEFIDQAVVALKAESLPLRHAALVAVQRFAELGDMYRKIAIGALRPLDMNYLLY